MSNRRRVLITGIATALALAGYFYYRNAIMDRLFTEAAGYMPLFRSTAQSRIALSTLASYNGKRSQTLVLKIALGQGSFLADTQIEAIKALRGRTDPEIANALADLLQPFQGLDTRRAVADTLQDLPCGDQCIRSVLHYLERIWHGEPNDEDRWLPLPGTEDVIASHKKEQVATYAKLHSVLQHDKPALLTNLVKIYGLGSNAPTPFALDLVSHVKLVEACPILLKSDQTIRNLPSEDYSAPRQELRAAVTGLNCR